MGSVAFRKQRRAPQPGGAPLGLELCCCLIAALLLLLLTVAWADDGCNNDCRNEYVSALGECRLRYQQSDKDAQDFEDCLADTRNEYDDCVDDCTELGAGGVIACASPRRALTAFTRILN